MVLIGFGCFSSFWASLVVVALTGISGKRKIVGCHWFVFFFANFWVCFVIVAAAHFCFWGVPGISNTSKIIVPYFSPGKPTKWRSTWLSPRDFPNLAYVSHFFHIPFISFQKTIVGHSGNGWDFFLPILASFGASLVISCPLLFFGVSGTSSTPRTIFPLGKAHRMALNLALS